MKRLLTLLSGTALAAALSFGAQAPANNAPAQTPAAPTAKKHVKKHTKKNAKSSTSAAPAASSTTPAKK